MRSQPEAKRDAAATRASILAKANWPSARRPTIVALRLSCGTIITMICDCIRVSLQLARLDDYHEASRMPKRKKYKNQQVAALEGPLERRSRALKVTRFVTHVTRSDAY
jgi:hypothetical protein